MSNGAVPASVSFVVAYFILDFPPQDLSYRNRVIAIEQNFSNEKIK